LKLTPLDLPALNIPLLERLRRATGQFVDLTDLGPSRERVWDDLDALAAFGFQIERHPYLGAAYRGPTSRLCPDQIEHGLGTRWIGRRIAVWNRVASTNDLAAKAALSSPSANDGLAVLAEEQTMGRGQRGRMWTAPPGSSILMSVLVFPPRELAPIGADAPVGCAWLTALAAVATAEVVSSWGQCDARIKWPNDVRVCGKKIAGILLERVPVPAWKTRDQLASGTACSGVVVGVGLNANIEPEGFPPELRGCATSLSMLANGAVIDRSEVVRELLQRLDHWYGEGLTHGPGTLSASWRERCEHFGKMIRVHTLNEYVQGRLVDLDLQRGMVLELELPDGLSPNLKLCAEAHTGRKVVRLDLGNIRSIEAYGTN
jgi:BirA family biotin operon repressor/biotin-[acetyl-CoA-carboxylase] ligase